MAEVEARFELEPGSLAPRLARHRITTLLEGLRGIDRDTVGLLVSELVTNAVIHAGSTTQVHVVADDDQVRVEIGDRSPTPPLVRPMDRSAIGGHGVRIVDALADRWGVLGLDPKAGPGKIVWFELDRRPAD